MGRIKDQKAPGSSRRHAITCLLLGLLCACVYELTTYGGIRSPDSEVVFRTSESLVTRGTFAIDELETWQGFGMAKGHDGREYSLFGVGQAIVASPLVALGKKLEDTGFFERTTLPLPISFYAGDGLGDFVLSRPMSDRNPHGVRSLFVQGDVAASALLVVLFYLVALQLVGSSLPALFASIMLGFGTMAWPYAGTCFSEPLASLFSLASFYLLLINDKRGDDRGGTSARGRAVFAGVCLGLATITHITAILFPPFFLYYAWHPLDARRRASTGPALAFIGGLVAMLVLLGYYNFARFGDPLQTGRTVDPVAAGEIGYGRFVNPLHGLHGLLASSNKGLLLYCPIVVLALIAWPRFARLRLHLALTVAALVIFRIIFIASRSDWTGGFSLGPRYLVMIMPFVCMPIAVLANHVLQAGRRYWCLLVGFGCVFIVQQWYFSVGEIFSFYHLRWRQALDAGIDLSAHDRFYFMWDQTPLLNLLHGLQGPFLLRQLHLSNQTLFHIGCVVILAVGLVSCLLVPVPRAERGTAAQPSLARSSTKK